LIVSAVTHVELSVFDGASTRHVSVTCPEIEACPHHCIVIGASIDAVNGTYNMIGFDNGSPIYINEHNIRLQRNTNKGRPMWIFCRTLRTIYYRAFDSKCGAPESSASTKDDGEYSFTKMPPRIGYDSLLTDESSLFTPKVMYV